MVIAYLRSLAARFFRRGKTESEMDEELWSHVQMRADALERDGWNRTEAERQARIEFGSTEQFKEECREAHAGNFLDILIQDVRYSLRLLRKSPGFAAVAILTMALCISATTAIFSVVDATLLHPLPYPHPDQLVRIIDDLPGVGAQDVGMSEPEWQDLQHSGIFQNVSPTWYDDNNLTGIPHPARVSLSSVAPNYFSLLGVKAELGRTFPASDHSPSFTGEVVISDGLWKRIFGSDSNILAKSIRMDTDLYRIVGVMPPSYHDPGTSLRERNIEVWAATSFYGPPMSDHPARNGRNLPTAIARLADGLNIEAAQKRIDALVANLHQQYPGDYPAQSGWRIRLVPLQTSIVGNVRDVLIMLLMAVGFVFAIGCLNIANLLLARGSSRYRELAIRRALGAGRGRLTRQLLTESLLLSIVGGGVGLALLFWGKDLLIKLIPESLPRLNEVAINWPVLIFAIVASVASGLIFGLVPALHLGRIDLMDALKRESRSSTSSRGQARTRRILVVTEFALSVVLMISAGLLLHSFWDLLNAQLGFNPQSVMTVKTRMPYPNDVKIDAYATPAQQAPFFHELLRRCKTLPGVEEVAIGDIAAIPVGHDRNNQNPPISLVLENEVAESNSTMLIDESIVAPEYFHLMGITVLRGRTFIESDNDQSQHVAVINGALAKKLWPEEDPIGKHVKLNRKAIDTVIIGVVANARIESLENPRVPEIYSSIYQYSAKHIAIFLRGRLDAATIPDQVREQVQAIDPTLPVFGAELLNNTVSASLSQRRFALEMVGLFALTALFLAAIGIYGVISYIVNERTHEIGIRLALGAQPGKILQMLLGQGLTLALAGAIAGLAIALIVSRLMAHLLYGITPADPVTFAGVILLLIAVALFACYLPARRAMRVDPMAALRCE